MIFVTVGTHEQPFNRLLKKMDELVAQGVIREEVVIQTGYSTYHPKYCKCAQFLTYEQMWQYVREARITITHGGPSSFIMPLQIGKIPIVVPRQSKYKEHVNNHQLTFANEVYKKKRNIIVIEHISDLGESIKKYDQIAKSLSGDLVNHNAMFNKKITEIIDSLF